MTSRAVLGLVSGSVAIALQAGCQEAPVRPELVLYVDLDMPVRPAPDVCLDAIVDTVRIELYAADDATPVDARTFNISSPEALPLSFGIRSDASPSGSVRVRIRAFRAAFADPGELDGQPVLDPQPQVSVDRLVALDLPSVGLVSRSVVLRGDCMGIRSRSGLGDAPDTTCIDGDNVAGSTTDGTTEGALRETVSDTWEKGRVIDCGQHEPPEGAICVPGGFAILGDPLFLALDEFERDALPLRPLTLPPFFMDVTEVTVGELRELVAAGYDGPLPMAPDPLDDLDRFCSWSPDADAELALSCVSVELAEAVCERRGGLLPSEAQWEHAARGRGRRDIFVWGEAPTECCSSSIAYFAGGSCEPVGPAPVASHPTDEDCAGDITRDGIVDLNGGLSELMRDSIASYADDCWASSTSSEILTDPVCVSVPGRVARGGNWNDTIGQAALPVRDTFAELDPAYGFRCVYEVPP